MKTEVQYIHSLTYEDIARSLARDFFRVFCVNTTNNIFVEFIPHENDHSLDICTLGDDFRKIVKEFQDSAYAEDMDTVRTAFTKSNILNVLNADTSFSLNYRMVIDGAATYVMLKASRIRQEDPTHILVALSNTDAHMRRLAIYERAMQRSLTYAGIAEALAFDYFCIYYINTTTGEFIEYKSNEEYKKLKLPAGGDDFFETCRTSVAELVYVDDRDTYLQAVNKENLMRVLSLDRMFLLSFRIMLDGVPTYIRMKATRMAAEDNHHIVIGLSNIDASMKRIAQYELMKSIANRDPLTGVKSKHAYTEAEEHFNLSIHQEDSFEFAVVVCDVNGLKQINDTLGHKAGDKYIRDACTIICEVFKRSPVFRIGGDEFVVLLTRKDYENRTSLMDSINRIAEKNRDENSVVVSAGLSEYIPGVDHSVSDVFERADALMYKRKSELKGTSAEVR